MSIEDRPDNVEPDGALCQLIIDNDFEDGLLGLVPGKIIIEQHMAVWNVI